MKFVIVFVALFGLALAAPPQSNAEATVLRQDSNVGAEGYQFSVETSDGKSHSEEGQLKNIGTENEALSVRGSFTYLGDDGVTYSVSYVADENGFQPSAAHLPVAPVA
ncbi:larval cuticle protein 65Ag1-like [Episyrphus balteatus]|uniref:larval cuticle protein 65Ag1-like n=1 Tax=Episyrphus balteatus TaxID=286459 RepID=UPI002485CBFB|nr:larval cuticle protein 65Ag1-like [Episyrphus balteatus]XP_055846609.1 larval cuticle protein 65Ag1-like [Episyrphus balteatus]XP_055846610.1 larval cuticle protein 65Ag1-like [Episyrphus balteatus]XP_055846618.1 larval cuticle protein 65Ag1-like [Episyrphus balteatus]